MKRIISSFLSESEEKCFLSEFDQKMEREFRDTSLTWWKIFFVFRGLFSRKISYQKKSLLVVAPLQKVHWGGRPRKQFGKTLYRTDPPVLSIRAFDHFLNFFFWKKFNLKIVLLSTPTFLFMKGSTNNSYCT